MATTYTNKTKVPMKGVQGSKISRRLFLYDRVTSEKVTLTDYTFRGSVKDKRTGNTVASFTFTLQPDSVSGDPDKVVACDIDAVTMAGIPAANYDYDIEAVPPEGEAYAVLLMSGTFSIAKEVTT